MMRTLLLSIATAMLLTGPWAASAIAQEFTLQPGDTLSISVLEDPTLDRQVLVRPDGKISMPIVGTITAGDRTPEEVQAAIVTSLSDDFLTAPTVTVAVTGLGAINATAQAGGEILDIDGDGEADLPGRVFVIGVVGNPGPIEFLPDQPLTVLQALAVAGGPGVFAARKRIQIRRQTDTGEEVYLYNYHDVERGDAPIETLTLLDGDVIVVPERGIFE